MDFLDATIWKSMVYYSHRSKVQAYYASNQVLFSIKKQFLPSFGLQTSHNVRHGSRYLLINYLFELLTTATGKNTVQHLQMR